MSDTLKTEPRKGAVYLKKLACHLMEESPDLESDHSQESEILQESLSLINKMEALVRKSVSLSAASKYLKNSTAAAPPAPANTFRNLTDSGKATLTNQSVVKALMELKESQASQAQQSGRLPRSATQPQAEFQFSPLLGMPQNDQAKKMPMA